MPISDALTARCFRLSFGIGVATFAAYALAIPLGYLLIIVVLALLANPAPPPPAKGAILLILVTLVTSLFGMLLGPVLTYAPVAGVLLSLSGVALAVVVGQRPGLAVIGTLMIVASTIIAAIAVQSSAAAVMLVKVLVGVMIGAVIIAHLAHALFPEPPGSAVAPPPPLPPGNTGWIALRTAVIILPPLLLALSNPASYIMLLIKGASLAQQAESTTTRRMAGEIVGATAVGGIAALMFWNLLQLWPGLLLLTLGMALVGLIMARPLYGAVKSRFSPDFWQFALTTMVILIGPAVADTASADNIQRLMFVRFLTFLALGVYAAAAVHLLDRSRFKRFVHAAQSGR
jgi:hypothetical protein